MRSKSIIRFVWCELRIRQVLQADADLVQRPFAKQIKLTQLERLVSSIDGIRG